jgi:hypothetical protein
MAVACVRDQPDICAATSALARGSDLYQVEEVWRRAGLDELVIIWNRACSFGADCETTDGTPPGVANLSYLCRIYSSAMSGGLGFAVEVNEPFRLQRAVDALHYFGLSVLAALVADLLDHDLDGHYADSQSL